MTTLIDPVLNPYGPFPYLQAYWYCTYFRAIYRNEPGLVNLVGALVGMTEFHQFDGDPPVEPKLQIMQTSAYGSIVHVEGTTVPGEFYYEIAHSTLISRDLWPGRVVTYFSRIAMNYWDRVREHLQPRWIAMGHSLGGAIAGLLSWLGQGEGHDCYLVVDVGAPREGNLFYTTQRNIPRLKIQNNGDLVTMVPPTLTATPDIIVVVPVDLIAGAYHWGERRVLWPDGTITRPTSERWAEQDFWQYGEAIFGDGIGLFEDHGTDVYSRRVRGGIPVAFPLPERDPDFPGLFELDSLQMAMNAEDKITWEIDGSGGPRIVYDDRVIPPVFLGPQCNGEE